MRPAATLKRSLSLPLITLYGLGTTVGAGIYVLTGEVAGSAGHHAPISFLLASLLAAFTALSFAELSSRFPRSAGEAVYVYEGFHWQPLATAIGLLVVLAGIVSSATISRGFVGYFQGIVDGTDWLILVGVVLVLGGLAAWGIAESVAVAAALTVVEIAGLALVIWAGGDALGALPARYHEVLPPFEGIAWLGIASGAVLAFYAFIGFEDMVNVAEEVRDVSRNLPRAIILTLGVTTALYLVLALAAILTVAPVELAQSGAPLALVYERGVGLNSRPVLVIGMVAALNGALIQIIMAARVLYGLAAQGWLPKPLGHINSRTRTPIVATGVATAIVLLMALTFPLVTLAQVTSLITLVIFATVNLALLRVKSRGPAPLGRYVVPSWVPALGLIASAAFALYQIVQFAR